MASHSRPAHLSDDMVTALYLQTGEVYAVVTRTSIVGYNIQEGEEVRGRDRGVDGAFGMLGKRWKIIIYFMAV